jgi:hypothetical protein
MKKRREIFKPHTIKRKNIEQQTTGEKKQGLSRLQKAPHLQDSVQNHSKDSKH